VYTAEKDSDGFRFKCGRYDQKLGASKAFPLENQSFDQISDFCHNFNTDYDNSTTKSKDSNSFIQNLFNVLVFQDLFASLLDYVSFDTANFLIVFVFLVGLFQTMSLKWRPLTIWFWFVSVFFSIPYFWNNGPSVL
jgi:hypothetical protein